MTVTPRTTSPSPSIPKLVGVAEVAAILQLTKQRVVQLRQELDKEFPLPIQILRSTPLWLESDIRKWAKSYFTR